ncbi:erythromycin esterase family protein [Nonlabens agnitus]|uniref:erythromycin esterase family protein n=1 Tax=Nonlabens agnitus TaxID=870484 RepID=UPI001559F570|nr:erythromycin esterase family protein [Nonlabens agnitus]
METQNVKTFIIEDSYVAEAGINEWISGGKGNVETIAENLTIYPWRTKEVVNLLQWMRNYNLTEIEKEQIRFFGMDIQVVTNINNEIHDAINEYNITVSDELLSIMDKCVEKKIVYNYGKENNWADTYIPRLNELENILLKFKINLAKENTEQLDKAIRALAYIIKYTYYIQNHYSQDRDLKMYENVKWIVENKSNNGKAFIWAHNEHINNRGFLNYTTRKIHNLGWHLKQQFKDDYYSVGFDFGKGALRSYIINDDQSREWQIYNLEKPYPKTYAETLIEAEDDIYFIDMANALKGSAAKFFDKKKKQLLLGGPGYNLIDIDHNFQKKRFSKAFDGLIFVESISPPNRNLRTD